MCYHNHTQRVKTWPFYQLPHTKPCCIACESTENLIACRGCELAFVCKAHNDPLVFESHSAACDNLTLACLSLYRAEHEFEQAYGHNPATLNFRPIIFNRLFGRQKCSVDMDVEERDTAAYRVYWHARWNQHIALLRIETGPATIMGLKAALAMREQELCACPRIDSILLYLSLNHEADEICWGLLVSQELEWARNHERKSSHHLTGDDTSTSAGLTEAQQRSDENRSIFDPPFIRGSWEQWQPPESIFLQLFLKLRALSNLRCIHSARMVCGRRLPIEICLMIEGLVSSELLVSGNEEVKICIGRRLDLTYYVALLEKHCGDLFRCLTGNLSDLCYLYQMLHATPGVWEWDSGPSGEYVLDMLHRLKASSNPFTFFQNEFREQNVVATGGANEKFLR